MNEPLVSVQMITYNHKPYIRQAIEGVLKQKTDFPFELVIGEDCSTDGTREIVFEYAKKYPNIVRVVTSEKNVGARKNSVRTRNACKGKYLAFCEGDDFWHRDDKLQLQVNYLEQNESYGLVHSEFNVINTEKNINISNYHSYRRTKPNCASFINIISGKSPIRTCTVLVRRNLVQKAVNSDPILFSKEKFLMGDTQLWAELSKITKIGYMHNSLATYRILSESLSRSKNPIKNLEFLKSTLEMKLYLLDKYNLYPSYKSICFKQLSDCNLRLAFWTVNKDMGRLARNSLRSLNLRQLILFLGSQNAYFNLSLQAIIKIRNAFDILYKKTCSSL